ncbi:3-hydroxyacyl-CoA dehydrogenase NAD-binding domain-containing protein [Coxiella burnetii]|uniref:3-hydroxyacyl-CoA dehydrogenase NAD-binding domain-containing protein n=1 Tax=Coxiella burnetii TaxID=777 RepID=UPI000183D0F6|nr:3-hydroxyacyl-CoA dehydrogenase NAD-binding domain-containing protein [Coxiella burnetii]ACJ20446.1 enoyl-CoA hydratase [Coxiella burnetii CbuK_Q154]PHH57409.1 crotonase [Coxiella burnetii]
MKWQRGSKMRELQTYKHWKIKTDKDGILWLTLDREDTSVNSMNREVFTEFNKVLDEIAAQNPIAVILQSGKKKGFIAGADIKQFTDLKNKNEAFDLIRQAQLVLDKLEALPMPTVAMISGFCLGGGLEVALACRYRVAEDNESTLIGLPEVKLGIHPGWGGTVRLPKLIGAPKAMEIMLPGAAVPARKAAKLGMVDAAVPLRNLENAARYFALQKPPVHKPKGWEKYTNVSYIRPWLGRLFYKKLSAKVEKTHYPAPYAIVHNWIKEGVGKEAYFTEAQSIAQLMMTESSRNMVRLFFLRERLKSLAKKTRYLPQQIHVIGAGVMGGDIAAWCALRGIRVTLHDKSAEKIAPAIKRAHALYEKKLKIPRLIQAAMDRLEPNVEGTGVKKADLIIEAVFEDIKVKQEVLSAIEPQLKPEAILATNTSSLSLDELSSVLKNPERLVAIHFFNPVAKLPLVEVASSQQTSADIAEKALAFVGAIDKLPLAVSSSPGFLVNRALMAYLLEANRCLDEGFSMEQIDKAATDFGMPIGPIELADRIGLDICLSVAQHLKNFYKHAEVSERLKTLVKEGHLGAKTGQGFYHYQNGRRVESKSTAESTNPDLTDRLILQLVNEVKKCLDEKVIDKEDLADAGIVFGTGFAPFRGGPMQYAKSRGEADVVKTLKRLAKQYGERFLPSEGWSA